MLCIFSEIWQIGADFGYCASAWECRENGLKLGVMVSTGHFQNLLPWYVTTGNHHYCNVVHAFTIYLHVCIFVLIDMIQIGMNVTVVTQSYFVSLKKSMQSKRAI